MPDNARNSPIVYNSFAGSYLLAEVEFTENPVGSGNYDMTVLTRRIAANGSPLGAVQAADFFTCQPNEAKYNISYAL